MSRRELLVNLLRTCNSNKSVSQLHCWAIKAGLIHDSFFATKMNSLYAEFTSLNDARKLFDETPKRSVYLWNAILRSYCREKHWGKALCLFHQMISNASSDEEKPDNFTVPIALKACAGLKAIEFGKAIHGLVKKCAKIGPDMFVGAALIELYSKCGQMGDALKVFEEFSKPDVVLWTSMVTGYEHNGYPEEALSFFSEMTMVERVNPDRVTLVSLVSACAQLVNLKAGSCVHGSVIRRGLDADLSMINSLLNLYAKTGSVKVASSLFLKMPEKDVISWSSMIACYALNGAAVEALNLFNEMIDKGVEPNSVTVISALQACAVACNLEEGKKIHELAARKGFEFDVLVSTALIDMYLKCASPHDAVDHFHKMPRKDVVSWAALLSGYAQNGMANMSMGVFCNMLSHQIQPDAVAMVKILAACSELGNLQQALCLHGYVVRSGFSDNAFVGASLIELYSKCGSLEHAIEVFQGLMHRDVVIWSSIIAAYGVHGHGEEALKIFNLMVKKSVVRPNSITFLSMLSACSHSGLVEDGIKVFNMMLYEYKLKPYPEHYGIMVDLLGRTGELSKAVDVINQMPVPAGPHVWGALLGACRIHHNTEKGEIAAKNIFLSDPSHAGYYILLSNIYAVDGKWDNVENLRNVIKEKGLKKMFGQSILEV